GAGINPADVKIALSGNNGSTLVVTFRNSDDRITINNGSASDARAIEKFTFADGTVWNFADIVGRWKTPPAGADVILGTVDGETLAGGAGNDSLYAFGSETLLGEAGDDTLTGTSSGDTFAGGTGTDTMYGAWGNDVYRWGRGDGND